MVERNIEERRAFMRAKRILSVRHRLVNRQNKNVRVEWHLSMTEDMSAGGLLFSSAVHYLLNDIVEVHVVMSGVLDIFRGYGRVVRVEKKDGAAFFWVAVQYTALKQKATRSAKSFLTRKRLAPRKVKR